MLAHRHQYARDWKARTGGKVVGYLCTYVPEELIYATGSLPVRIMGSHEPQDITEPYIPTGMWCPFCRDTLAQGLRGRYEYLDGIVIAFCCMHVQQTFESWRRHIPIDFAYNLYVPQHVQSQFAKGCLVGELQGFKKALEGWTGRRITERSLEEAIEVYNAHRRLLGQVYELRKGQAPPLTGAEAMEMVLSGMCLDKAEHNRLLEKFLQTLPGRKVEGAGGPRLMLLGSEDDDTEFLRMVESLGAIIVTDDHCTGSRYFLTEVGGDGDPLEALATRYLARPPCPVKDLVKRRRLEHILKLAQGYRVQGVILVVQKFCDAHLFDMPPIQRMLNEHHIPTLFLELDVTIPLGQFRTRVEAFLEMLEMEAA